MCMWMLVVDVAGQVVLLCKGLPAFNTGEGQRGRMVALCGG